MIHYFDVTTPYFLRIYDLILGCKFLQPDDIRTCTWACKSPEIGRKQKMMLFIHQTSCLEFCVISLYLSKNKDLDLVLDGE